MTGAEIRAARESLGLTQLQFAQVLGYAHVTRISEFEHGKGSPSAQTVLLIRLYLSGVRPDYWPKNARTA